jgi:hypothetical protein
MYVVPGGDTADMLDLVLPLECGGCAPWSATPSAWPAQKPLEVENITVQGDSIVLWLISGGAAMSCRHRREDLLRLQRKRALANA